MTGKLAVSVTKVLDALARGTCLRDAVRTAESLTLSTSSARDLGAVAFGCLAAAGKLGAGAVVATLATIISSLAAELVASASGLIDTATGNANHTITLTRNAPLWTARRLTITPTSLGGVRVGMTLAEAQAAAGAAFDAAGDGYSYPSTLPAGYPHLYVGRDPVDCVGAEGASTAQAVATPEGFRLGDSVRALLAVYGSRARYVPAPTGGGMTDYAEYIVAEAGGNLVFMVDPAGQRVTGIAGGGSGLDPNSCTG